MTYWRALCAQLVEQLDDALDFTVSSETRRHMKLLTRQARSALAEPEPAGPSFSDVMEWSHGIEPWATWLAPGGCLESAHFELDQLVTSAIARWGRPAPQLVPVSERSWAREGWCDESGRCWFGWAAEADLPPDASWTYCRPSERDTATVSLPAHALPLPQPS